MMNSTTKNNLRRIALTVLGVAFWILAWQLAAIIVNKPYLLPDVPKTLLALCDVVTEKNFWWTVFLTLLRVLTGLTVGLFSGVLLAILTNRFTLAKAIVTPIISVIKSTPVATFIMILWILLDGSTLAIFIAFLMVMPIVWQNVSDGFSAIDKELSEVCDAFEFSYKKRIKLLVIPTLSSYLFPAIITSVGLAWKSEIAAEIIAYTRSSIGALINDAKYNFETPKMFALTIIVVIMSLILEAITKSLIRRYNK